MTPGTEKRLAGGAAAVRRRGLWFAAGLALVALAIRPAPALANSISVDLNVLFDTGDDSHDGSHGDDSRDGDVFGRVQIEEVGGDLAFSIELTGAFGESADLREFYFSLAGDFNNLQISPTDSPNAPFTLEMDPSLAGGAGASFEYGVIFGRGERRRGDSRGRRHSRRHGRRSGRGDGEGEGRDDGGAFCCASFRLSADEDLGIDDLRVTTFVNDSEIPINLAVHVQSSDFDSDDDSETIGGLLPSTSSVPEPGTGPLLALSLIGLAARQRARPRSAKGSSPSVDAR